MLWVKNEQSEEFYNELLKAVKETPNLRLRDRVAIRTLRFTPRLLNQVHQQCNELVQEEFEADMDSFSAAYPDAVKFNGESYGIDWNGLTNFLKEILPIILPLILKLLTGV